ncbi:Gcr2p Ecym_6443 [Eremothecium cymbalariae DBVPG|uniref:Uncharacterized protein n=1 Tax=Eremothecium cymbalariae (strain CBS 270.75 / DBVPG 7215 / KCTC 17166 / NRRL Y-17582) TaxID=931890 RepID=G8JUN4_ERECY|nr:hypothetical protein Ecym_6443 [Eremothecium cymbalariae DBVPG\
MASFDDRRGLASSVEPFNSGAGIMHHQIKLDVFLIKGYQVVSRNAVIDGDAMSSMSASPTSSTVGSDQAFEKPLLHFQELSKLYNVTIQVQVLDDGGTSPKSAIELCQRFQQILKELELSYEVSPYAKYFKRLSTDGERSLWQVRDDAELQGDAVWVSVSANIKKLYNSEHGRLDSIQSKRRSAATSVRNSPRHMKDDPVSYQQLKRKLTQLQANSENSPGNKKNKDDGGSANDGTCKVSNPNILDFLSNGHLKNKFNDSDALLRGYYTMPTSPTSLWNAMNLNTSRRRDFQNPPENDPVEELLQLTATASSAPAASVTAAATSNGNTDDPSDDPLSLEPTAKDLQKDDNDAAATATIGSSITSELPMITDVPNIPTNPLTIKETDLYDRLLQEKDEKIIELGRQLKNERDEIQWLRKLLLEDIGCIRSMLKELRDR